MHSHKKRHGWMKRQTGFKPTANFDDPQAEQPVETPPPQGPTVNPPVNTPTNPTPGQPEQPVQEPDPPFNPGPKPNPPQPSQPAQPSPQPNPPVERPPANTPSSPPTPSQPAPVPAPPPSQPPTPSLAPSPSTPPPPPPSQPSTHAVPPPVVPSSPPVQKSPVQSLPPSFSPSSASPSNSALSDNATTSSNSKAGAIAGGIIAALVGAGALFLITTWFLRRAKRRREEMDSPFDPQDFRKSGVMLHDDEPFRATPPVMAESRTPASPAPTFGTQYGAPPPMNYHNTSGYNDYGHQSGPYPSMQPGQYMNTPVTANSAHPMWDGSVNGSEPGTPQMYGQGPAQYAHYAVPPQPMNDGYLQRQPSVNEQYLGTPVRALTSPPPSAPATPASLHRQPSLPSPYPSQGQGVALSRQPSSGSTFADDYVDLSRSSVSPYQAMQYAEISKQLGSELPTGLNTAAGSAFIVNQPALDSVGEEKEPISPPANVVVTPPAPTSMPIPAAAVIVENEEEKPLPSPFDDANAISGDDEDYDFPAPPALTNRRIDSTPPKLPELHLRNGSASSGYDFTAPSFGATAEGANEKLVPPPSPLGATPVFSAQPEPEPASAPAPAPDASLTVNPSLTVTKPEHEMKMPATAPAHTTEFATPRENVSDDAKKRPDTMYTIYDPDDAYGGI